MVLKRSICGLCIFGLYILKLKRASVHMLGLLLGAFSAGAWAAPQAENDSRQAPQNIPVVVDVLSNDAGDGVLTLVNFSQPAKGIAEVSRGAGGGLRVVPNLNYWGEVNFTYQISDSSGELSQANVTITITRTQSDNDVLTQTLSLNTIAQINQESLASHSRALSQFARTRENQNQQGQWVYRGPALGAAAGDSPLALGGIFVSLNSSQLDSEASGYNSAAETQITGATLGADFNVNTAWTLGGAVGFSSADAGNNTGEAVATVDEKSLLGFASYRYKHWLAEWQLVVSNSDITGRGGDTLGGLAYSTDGKSSYALGKLEYAFANKQWQLMPGFSVHYQRNALAAFTAPQVGRTTDYAGQTTSHLLGALSLYADYALTFNWGVLLPQVTLASEYCIDKSNQNTQVTVNGENFTLPAAQVYDSHQIAIDAGLAVLLTHGFSGFVNYHHLAKNQLYSTQAWQVGARWEF